MEKFPLPSRVHYELLLQLLERKTLIASEKNPMLKKQVQQLIISLRKALAQQKHLESLCQQTCIPVEHRWSLNSSQGSVKISTENEKKTLNSSSNLAEES